LRSPIAVATGDSHFTLGTLELASSALRQMILKAKELHVPIILNGDTLDAKAIIRGEIANRLIEILGEIESEQVYINTGNHDMLSEKGDNSALNFLRPYAQVVSSPVYIERFKSYIVPYFNDTNKLKEFLHTVDIGTRLIIHQGVMGADLGHYVKDSTSLPTDSFSDFRVIASHYHKRQDIKCGPPRKGAVGLFSYLGSPYSITYSEANDGPKGFNILYDDGTLELVPTNLRKHVKLELTTDWLSKQDRNRYSESVPESNIGQYDLLWVKLTGPESELARVFKAELGHYLQVNQFKLDKIPTEVTRMEETKERLTEAEIMDRLIDQTEESLEEKKNLKGLWRETLA